MSVMCFSGFPELTQCSRVSFKTAQRASAAAAAAIWTAKGAAVRSHLANRVASCLLAASASMSHSSTVNSRALHMVSWGLTAQVKAYLLQGNALSSSYYIEGIEGNKCRLDV